jgi:hypothetical protein
MKGITILKNNNFLKNKVSIFFMVIMFIVFIKPFSFDIGGEGVSGNYLFVLFPLFYYSYKFWGKELVYLGELKIPQTNILLFGLLLLGIYLVAHFSQPELSEYSIRRFLSFIVFMSIFTFMFVKIDINMISAFKYAIVIFSIYASIKTLILYIDLGGAELGTYAKGAVGGNRSGFIYVFALWSLYFFNSQSFLTTVLKHFAASIIIIGILLTFSRASSVALASSTIAYLAVLISICVNDGKSLRQILKKLSLSVTYIFVITILMISLFPNTLSQSKRMIFDFVFPYQSKITIQQIDNSTIQQIDNSTIQKIDNSTIQKIDNSTIQKIDNSTFLKSELEAKAKATIENLSQSRAIQELTDKTSSLGYRVYVGSKAINFVSQNPFTGSGYLGVWVVLDKIDGKAKGSAHGQWVDVLFRIGILGFIAYIFFVYKILNTLFRKDPGLFIGFIGIIFYGFFHETFKLSHGAFIFAFLFALYDQRESCFRK